jgi:hypothetical protein
VEGNDEAIAAGKRRLAGLYRPFTPVALLKNPRFSVRSAPPPQ